MPPYNPYLYESLLSDVGKLLDRCLTWRRECADLEAQGVRRALEFKLFYELYDRQQKLQELTTSTSALEKQRDSCNDASTAFGTGAIEKGFKALYAGTASAAQEQIQVEQEKRNTLQWILKRIRDHQDLLKTRHTTAGHALNFAERRNRIIPLIIQDIVEAYQKARAAEAGIRVQLSVNSDHPFPTIWNDKRDAQFLDAFVLWTRSLVSNYELKSQEDVVFEQVIPLVAPWTRDSGGQFHSVISGGGTEFSTKMKEDGLLRFNLNDVLPSRAGSQFSG